MEIYKEICSIVLLNMLFGYQLGSSLMICCLLYTSDAADEGLGVDLGGRRIIKKCQMFLTKAGNQL